MGRKPIPIEPYIDKLEQALLIGATYDLAALYAGISTDTLDRWRKKAETAAPGTVLGQWRDRLRAAEGRAAIGWLAKIEKVASEGDWKAAAWKLERRYPETYGRTFNKLALTTPDGEQPWEPTVGLAALLEVARTSTNGTHPTPSQLPEAE
jgi:hypothetical protein